MIEVIGRLHEWALTELDAGESANPQAEALLAELPTKVGLMTMRREVGAVVRGAIPIIEEIARTKNSALYQKIFALSDAEKQNKCVCLRCEFILRFPDSIMSNPAAVAEATENAELAISKAFGELAATHGIRFVELPKTL